ncbi:MAG: hypothetical protein Q9166_007444 [cf. Caloplaca sp. 2 TL-2023]
MAKTSRLDSELPEYELIQRSHAESQSLPAPAESDDELEKTTSKLPPKPLPGRRKYCPFIVATLIAILNIVSFSVLMSYIKYMMPEADWYGLQLEGDSCDLMEKDDVTRWQSAFQINLRGATHLTFAQAKFIDLVFDLLVGQGGRLLLAAVSYIVFMDALLRSMEITPVSFQLYSSLVFSSTSLVATWRSMKAVSSTRGWRGKMYLIWCALAMIYVLAFPTLIESATGYVTPSSAGFNINNGQFITLDSDELNYTTNVTIDGQIHVLHNVNPSGELWSKAYCYHDSILDLWDLREIAYCFNKTYFVWGFSSIVLYVILALQIVWTFGMYCVWLDANLASELIKAGRTIRGPFRAAADLAEALNETLGHEYCAYTDEEIEKELKRSGEMLRYNSTLRDDDGLLHVGLTTKPDARVLLSRKKLYGAEDEARKRN